MVHYVQEWIHWKMIYFLAVKHPYTGQFRVLNHLGPPLTITIKGNYRKFPKKEIFVHVFFVGRGNLLFHFRVPRGKSHMRISFYEISFTEKMEYLFLALMSLSSNSHLRMIVLFTLNKYLIYNVSFFLKKSLVSCMSILNSHPLQKLQYL